MNLEKGHGLNDLRNWEKTTKGVRFSFLKGRSGAFSARSKTIRLRISKRDYFSFREMRELAAF